MGRFIALRLRVFMISMCATSFLLSSRRDMGKLGASHLWRKSFNIKLVVVESDLSVLCTCYPNTIFDFWILKDCRVNASWMKRFTIKFPQYVVLYGFDSPVFTFSIYLH